MDLHILTERCKNGNRDAMGELYTAYAPRLMKIILRYVADRQAAEDVLHDGFIVIFTHIADVKDPSKLEQWMAAIMRNLSIQYLQHIDLTAELDEDTGPVEYPEQESLLSYDELQAIIDRLPTGYRTVFRLSVLENKSHKEIAALLGIEAHSSSSQLYRAKVMLRRFILEYRAALGLILLLMLPLTVVFYLSRHASRSQEDHNGPQQPIADNVTPSPSATNSIGATPVLPQMTTTYATPRHLAEQTAVMESPLDTIRQASIDTIAAAEKLMAEVKAEDDTTTVAPTTKPIEPLADNELLAYTPTRHRPTQRWSVGVGFSTSNGSSAAPPYLPIQSEPVDPDTESPITSTTPTGDVEESTHHGAPLTVGLRISRLIAPRLDIETGLDFTYLRSRFNYRGDGVSLYQQTKAYYIGVPLKANYCLYTDGRWSVYTTVGIGIEIPVKSKLLSDDSSVVQHQCGAQSFSAPLQFNLQGGLGLQYKLAPGVSLYAEPSVRYYFGGSSSLPTLWQDRPTVFFVPIGLRLTW